MEEVREESRTVITSRGYVERVQEWSGVEVGVTTKHQLSNSSRSVNLFFKAGGRGSANSRFLLLRDCNVFADLQVS